MQDPQQPTSDVTAPRFRRAPTSAYAAPDPLATGQLGLITRDLAGRTSADRALLVLRDGADGPLELVSAWDSDSRSDELRRPPSAGGFVDRVLASGHAVVEPIDSEQTDNGASRPYAAGAPLRTPDGLAGVLCALYSQRPDLGLTRWIIEAYAQIASLCLHDPEVLDGLLAAARRDALTGCLSYGAIHEEMGREVRRSERHGRGLSCCFIDLDRFKAINDRYGHLHGSRVLADVAVSLRERMRDGDTLGRYGGDEFVALLPDTDERDAAALADRLRSGIATGRPDGASSRIDASIGVSQWIQGFSAEEMLASADDALREAKGAGGGMVVRASQLRLEDVPGVSPGERAWA